jgi:hypothetical protein
LVFVKSLPLGSPGLFAFLCLAQERTHAVGIHSYGAGALILPFYPPIMVE